MKLPLINLFGLVSLYTLRSRLKTQNLKNLKISIIVPCKNEENNISVVVNSIEKIGKETEVLFGNDNSSDNTKIEIKK